LSPAAPIVTSACRDEPTPPALRTASICLFTTSRISRSRCQRASSASSGVSKRQ
jgi:hypothetical protein